MGKKVALSRKADHKGPLVVFYEDRETLITLLSQVSNLFSSVVRNKSEKAEKKPDGYIGQYDICKQRIDCFKENAVN